MMEASSEGGVIFREGIELAINFCRAIQFNVSYGYLGSEPNLRIHNLCDSIFSCFIQSKDQPPTTKIALKKLIHSFLHLPPSGPLHVSIQEVSDELLAMYQECLNGDFTSIQIFKEANARRPMWKQVNNFEIQIDPEDEISKKANHALFDCQDLCARRALEMKQGNLYLLRMWRRKKKNNQQTKSSSALKKEKATPSEVEIIKEPNISCCLMHKQANWSEMDGSRVHEGNLFKEGVNLFMDNLWHHFSIQKKCSSKSNPIPMLQYLADVIFFWFTQTIKPLSVDHIQRILKNEIFCLPYSFIHDDTIKEVVKKLMVMYEECLQGNFSSVDILKEERLSWASSSCETTGIEECTIF